jgi:predicted SAM-dependent methyltransferase
MDCKIYRKYNSDLKNYTDLELENHFNSYGKNENRIYNLESLIKKNIHLIYFNIDNYKENNKDLKFESDSDYIIDYLENRINGNRKISSKLTEFKKNKQKLIQDKLKYTVPNNHYIKPYEIGINETESANEWENDSDISKLIKENNLILNIGAGYRKCTERYFSLSNVINTEVFNYPTTDIVCDGDNLPFKDNSFDVVLSLAVLEHVKNPWIHANEMIRVLKPGGIVYADVPFLQPYHGYPHHYYNMTTAGLQNLFEKKIKIIKHCVEPWSKPIYTLTWFLSKYCEFLDENSRKKFKKLTVNEILKNGNNIDLDYVKNLDKNKEEIIACGTTLIGKKI